MAGNEVTITVRDRDLTNPQRTRQKWRSAQKDMERDAERSARESGDRSGKSWLSALGASLGDGGGGGGAKRIESAVASMFTISAKTAATAFSAQFVGSVVAALASGAAKLAHGLGAMVALLPAAAVAGVTAFAALKLAVVGVGDALSAAVSGDAKEFHEAVQGLSPAARGFAGEVRGMRGELKGLQQSVQQSFFERFSGDAQKLGATYLPMVRTALSGIAGSFGDAAHKSVGFLNSTKTSGTLAMTLGHVRAAVGNVAGALPSLVRAFVPLVAVGSTFLPKLTSGLKEGAQRLAEMAEAGQKSGAIARFIQGGIDKLKSLWETGKQVGRIIGNVIDIFRQFGSAGGGVMDALGIETGGLLDRFEQLTLKAKAFFQSAEGGAAITEIFGILRSLLNATFGTLAHLVPIIGRAFAPILPQLSAFAEAVVNLQFALADALAPALGVVAGLLGAILPPITSVMNVIADSGPAAAALAGEILGLYAAWKLFGAATAVSKMNLSAAKVGMAGAAAAATGLAMALIAMDKANHAKQIEANTERFIAMDGAVNDSTKTLIFMSQLMGTLDEQFASIAASSPAHAQAILDNREAYGLSAEEAARLQEQLDVTTAAQDNLTDAITRTADALRATTDPIFAQIDAQKRLAEAQAEVARVEKDKNATTADAAEAQQALIEASLGLEGANFDLAAAIQNGDVQMNVLLASMKRQVKQGAISRSDYNATALIAVAAMGRAKNAVESIPKQRSTKIKAVDGASGVIGGVAAKLGWLNGQSATVKIGASVGALVGKLIAGGFAHGGITGAQGGGPRSRMTWVGEHGPELVNLPPGSHVQSNPDSERMAAAGGGHGPPVFVLGNPSDSLGRAVLAWLRDAIRDGHGGDVQRALGWGS